MAATTAAVDIVEAAQERVETVEAQDEVTATAVVWEVAPVVVEVAAVRAVGCESSPLLMACVCSLLRVPR